MRSAARALDSEPGLHLCVEYVTSRVLVDAPGWTLYGEQSALPLEDWMLRIGGISSAFLLGALTAFVCSTVVTATSPLQSCDKEFYNLEQQWQTRL